MIHFSASQSLTIPVPTQPLPIQHYLKQPQRLVTALVEPKQVTLLHENHFRLSMRPLNFMTVHIQPVVDLEISHGSESCLYLNSTGCEILGNEYISQRFQLSLEGFLKPLVLDEITHLTGTAHLAVGVELPPAFWLTPRPLLEATGTGLLKGVLLTMKQRLAHQLLLDYDRWVKNQMRVPTREISTASTEVSSAFSTQSSMRP